MPLKGHFNRRRITAMRRFIARWLLQIPGSYPVFLIRYTSKIRSKHYRLNNFWCLIRKNRIVSVTTRGIFVRVHAINRLVAAIFHLTAAVPIDPDSKNNIEQTYSCLKDYLLSASCGTNCGPPCTLVNYCIEGFEGALNWASLCRETPTSRTANVNFSNLASTSTKQDRCTISRIGELVA